MKRHFPPAICILVVVFTCAWSISVSTLLGSTTAAASTISRTLPEPSMAIGGEIVSSSCVTGPVCVSLGWNHHGNTGYVWAARWQGHTWSKLPAPRNGVPGGTGDTTISCATSTWCMATGSTGLNIGNHPIADELIGAHWKSLPVPTPKGSTDFSLYKLDCRSSTWCVGVGNYVANKPNYSDATFLASEVWNGSTWRIVPIFSPRTYAPQVDPGMVNGGAHPTAAPQQLSCVSNTFCVFTGFWTGVFVEEWNGHRWSEIHAPNEPKNVGSASEFSGGSCTSTTFCIASGGYDISNGVWRPLIEKWNGHLWRIVALPKLPKIYERGTGFRLAQVDCVSSDFCVAFGDPGLVSTGLNGLEWNGQTWSYVSTGNRARLALVCLTKTDCNLID